MMDPDYLDNQARIAHIKDLSAFLPEDTRVYPLALAEVVQVLLGWYMDGGAAHLIPQSAADQMADEILEAIERGLKHE